MGVINKKFIARWFRASLDTYKYEEKKLFRGKQEKEVYSQRRVNFQQFADRLLEIYDDMDSEGYDVVNVIPMAMGQSEPSIAKGGGYLGDMGFSITRGAVVIGKKRA